LKIKSAILKLFYEIIKDTALRASIEVEDIDIFINAAKILSATGNISFSLPMKKIKWLLTEWNYCIRIYV